MPQLFVRAQMLDTLGGVSKNLRHKHHSVIYHGSKNNPKHTPSHDFLFPHNIGAGSETFVLEHYAGQADENGAPQQDLFNKVVLKAFSGCYIGCLEVC